MSYISQEDYKNLMSKFQKETPKGLLKEDMDEQEMEEGNAFTAGLAKTKKGGEFKVGDKTFTDKTNYDAPMKEDDISKDVHGAEYHIGDKVTYQGHTFTIMIGAGGKVVLSHSSGKIIPNDKSMEILKQAAIDKKFGGVDEYRFDQMYPDDPGPFEGEMEEEAKICPGCGNPNDQCTCGEEMGEGAEKMNYQDPYALAAAVASAHPELQKFALEDRKMFQRAAFKYVGELMRKGGESDTVVVNLVNGYADEDWPSDFISALGKELEGIEEGLNMPPLQATGQTIVTNEASGVSILSPDERKQLKEFINSYKTIKQEISKLLEKAGKSGTMMETKMEDEKVPATRPAHYNDPTKTPTHKKGKMGGDRTGLVMTKAEMYEHDENMEGGEHEAIESKLDPKIHDAFRKVKDMAIKQLVAAGVPEDQVMMFLQHEMEEKGEEAKMAQYDM